MNITIAQIVAARSGKSFSKKWPNGKIPYNFDSSGLEGYEVGLSEEEQNIVKKVAQRFNKDLNGCASIRYRKILNQMHTRFLQLAAEKRTPFLCS